MKKLTLPLLLAGIAWTIPAAADGKRTDNQADSGGLLLADSCYGCHPKTSGAPAAMADLGQLSVDEIYARLQDYRNGEEQATVMNRIARGYTDLEFKELANHFGRPSP